MTTTTFQPTPTSNEELRRRVIARSTVQDTGFASPCWISNRAKNNGGYTKMGVDYVITETHRIAHRAFVGPIPEGMVIDHLCRVRTCCNPAHLEPVTHRENLLRGDTTTARNAAKTHCPEGHPLSGSNLISHTDTKGRTSRRCRQCTRTLDRAGYARRKSA